MQRPTAAARAVCMISVVILWLAVPSISLGQLVSDGSGCLRLDLVIESSSGTIVPPALAAVGIGGHLQFAKTQQYQQIDYSQLIPGAGRSVSLLATAPDAKLSSAGQTIFPSEDSLVDSGMGTISVNPTGLPSPPASFVYLAWFVAKDLSSWSLEITIRGSVQIFPGGDPFAPIALQAATTNSFTMSRTVVGSSAPTAVIRGRLTAASFTKGICDVVLPCKKLAKPEPVTNLSWNRWNIGRYEVSDTDGLILENVSYDNRYIAKKFSVPYLNVQTKRLPKRRLELKPHGDDNIGRSCLVDFRSDPPDDEKLVLEATYEIDRLPETSGAVLTITQRFEFYAPTQVCEPSGKAVCAQFKPIVNYQYVGETGNELVAVSVAERLHFVVDGMARNSVGMFKDCDLFDFCSFVRVENPLQRESLLTAIKGGQDGPWDNFHQTYKDTVQEPTPSIGNWVGIVPNPIPHAVPIPGINPGCDECVHIHWRWGAVVKLASMFLFPAGSVIIPDGSNQDLDVGVVAARDGEEDPIDVADLIGNEQITGKGIVLWYSGAGYHNSDTFFGHLHFVEPLPAELPPLSQLIFELAGQAATSILTADSNPPIIGFSQIKSADNSTTPYGLAILGLRQNNVQISKASVPAMLPVESGRVPVSIDADINTGLAVVNPNDNSVVLSCWFTDLSGNDFGSVTVTIPAKSQIVRFLSEAPFLATQPMMGTFTFRASHPVAITALRGRTNSRGEYLMSVLPVVPLTQSSAPSAFPYLVDGGGWRTTAVLVNPTEVPIRGTLHLWDQGAPNQSASPLPVEINGVTASAISYVIPPNSQREFRTSGAGSAIRVGSVRAVPESGSASPAGLLSFSFESGGTVVTEASVLASPLSNVFRLYAQSIGDFNEHQPGSSETGFVITNLSNAAQSIKLDLVLGNDALLSTSFVLPPNGQRAAFLREMNAFANMPEDFEGTLRISGENAALSVVGVLGTYNERHDFLLTTIPAIDESRTPNRMRTILPLVASGGGYTTQFVVFDGSMARRSTGILESLSESGDPLKLTYTAVPIP